MDSPHSRFLFGRSRFRDGGTSSVTTHAPVVSTANKLKKLSVALQAQDKATYTDVLRNQMSATDREVYYRNVWLEAGGNNEDWTFGEKHAHQDYIFDGRAVHTEGMSPFLAGAIQRANG